MDLDLPDMATEDRTFGPISGQVVNVSKEGADVKDSKEISQAGPLRADAGLCLQTSSGIGTF